MSRVHHSAQRTSLGSGWSRTASLGAFLLMAGCSNGGGSAGPDAEVGEDAGADAALPCEDSDGDGYGAGAGCLGDDCDDDRPGVWEEADCAVQCADDPHAPGCPCAPGEPQPESCYSGAVGTQNVGACVPGLRTCLEGHWSICEGEIVPGDETCNGLDDDCDEEVDEGALNECGTCGSCERDCLGEGDGCSAFDIDDEGARVVPCDDGSPCVTLAEGSLALNVLWIASAVNGTVSRLDTRERVEIARYRTGPLGVSAGYLSGPGDGPSRTSVDASGSVCIANRAFGNQSSVTRILVGDCPDQDGDGVVTTSTGGGDVYEWGEDECVLWNTNVGNPGGIARALAVQDRIALDGAVLERVWAGLFDEGRYVELDRTDGAPTGVEADCTPCTPYGAAISRDGSLWSACLSNTMCRFDTDDPTNMEILAAPTVAYGITVDEEGHPWFAAGGVGDTLTEYDPDSGEFRQLPGITGAGVAVDGEGFVWTGQCNEFFGFGIGATCRVNRETGEFVQFAAHSRGIAVDFQGFVWGVSMGGYLDVIDPGNNLGDETTERIFDDCGPNGAQGPCLPEPYTYSDMTGFQLDNATDPIGSYQHLFEGCDDAITYWGHVVYEADTPPGSRITLQVRAGVDLPDVLAAPWIDAGSNLETPSPIDLALLLGEGPHPQFLQVRAFLLSDDRVARPRLMLLGADKSCDEPFG